MQRHLINKGVSGVQFVQLSGEQIPFADNTFDCVSIAFGLLNVTDKDQCQPNIDKTAHR
jgi:demethylmenaquinone methyltransferase/2-methoxy-6-polyprenyl-1,4-benzoquinol methylase